MRCVQSASEARWCDSTHLLGDARRIEGGPDDARGDEQDQLDLLGLLLDGAKEQAQYEFGGWEMVYNPVTKEVCHLDKMK